MKKIVIAGGSGLIGKSLINSLTKEIYSIVLLTRNSSSIPEDLKKKCLIIETDYDSQQLAEIISDSYAVINLAGASVAGSRWTDSYKKIILQSRIKVSESIVEAIKISEKKPALLFNASAVGYYISNTEEVLDENASKGIDFLSEVSDKWENIANKANPYCRVVCGRIGIVLDKSEGALSKLLLPFRFFAGGALGSGKQWYSWIHIDDIAGLITFAIENQSIRGPLNLVSPHPVRMKEFVKTIGRILKRPSFFNVPSFLLKIFLGEMSSIVLNSQKVIPAKAIENDYKFRWDNLESALKNLLK